MLWEKPKNLYGQPNISGFLKKKKKISLCIQCHKIKGKKGKWDKFLLVRDKPESGWMSNVIQTSSCSLLNESFCYFIDPAFGFVKREKEVFSEDSILNGSLISPGGRQICFPKHPQGPWLRTTLFPSLWGWSSSLALPTWRHCPGFCFHLLLFLHVIFLADQTHSTLTLRPLLRGCLCAESLQSCLNLCGPMDCSPPGSSVHGILQARMLEQAAISFSRGSSWPRD